MTRLQWQTRNINNKKKSTKERPVKLGFKLVLWYQPHPYFWSGSRQIDAWFAWKIPNLSMHHQTRLSPSLSKATSSSEYSHSPRSNNYQNHATSLLSQTRLSPPFSNATLSSECSLSPWPNHNQKFDINIIGQTIWSPPFSKASLSGPSLSLWPDRLLCN